MSQNGQAHLKNIAANAARFLNPANISTSDQLCFNVVDQRWNNVVDQRWKNDVDTTLLQPSVDVS